MNFCPKCGTLIIPGNNQCSNCGEVIQNALVGNEMISSQRKIQTFEPRVEMAPQPESLPSVAPQVSIAPAVKPMVEMASQPEPSPAGVSQKSVETVVETAIQPEIVEEVVSGNEETVKEKNFNRIITLSIIVISVVAIVISSLFIFQILTTNQNKSDLKEVVSAKYNFEGFEFSLPDGVSASIEDNSFIMRDNKDSWSAIITMQEGNYNTLVSNRAQLNSYFEKYGYIATEVETKELNGTSFITTEVLIGSKNTLVAYTKASGTKVFGIIYINSTGTYNNTSLKAVSEILTSAVHSGKTEVWPDGFTFEMFKETFEVAR